MVETTYYPRLTQKGGGRAKATVALFKLDILPARTVLMQAAGAGAGNYLG